MATTAIEGWTGKTSYIMSNPINSGGYDIIDHVFGGGATFPSDLSNELRTNGWLDRLQRARTKMDVSLENIMQLSLGNGFIGTEFGGIERGVRGDESVFIPREVRGKESFQHDHPRLCRLIDAIETSAFGNLSDDFEFNKDMTSVQLATYPGDGKSGYPRHCDSGASCNTNAANTADSNGRILTFVYYLTPNDWDAKLDGGALRIYSPTDDKAYDIPPLSNRMVVFRSDHVEHQVLPSLRRERVAITVWLYGRPKSKITAENNCLQLDSPGHGLTCNKSNLPPPLPLPKSNAHDGETIFVAIPSYRDSETWPTIQSLLQAARRPERVFIGVVWQIDTLSPEEVRFFTDGREYLQTIKQTYDGKQFQWDTNSNFRSLTMDYRQATGPCYARHLAQTLHRGEEYVLQIDSHMRFRANWDAYLIQQLKKCKPDSSTNGLRAVLTAYPPNYDAPNGPGKNAETRATLLVPWKFGPDGILRQKGRLVRSGYTYKVHDNDNLPCLLYAGGFNFFHASMLLDCPYDHKLHGLFFGEEISMAVRLYTHGYNLFSPPETVCYHQWKRNSLRTSNSSGTNDMQSDARREASLKIVRMQLRGETGSGLGTNRTTKQFSVELGANFDRLTLSEDSKNGMLHADAFDVEQHSQLEHGALNSVLKLVDEFMNC